MLMRAWSLLLGLCLISISTAIYAADANPPPDAFQNLKFRNLGPASAGGRVSAVAGVPGNPSIYYVGGGSGGVWKTTDGGLSFKPIFEHEATSSIGAIALAPTNPNYVWVGTGEANIRNDVTDGAGVYFSPDAGKTWQQMGLKDVGQISRVIVSPEDPNTVWVAAIGHTWAPNIERGVFKTIDGGKTWKKVLFVSEHTGASDLSMSDSNPKVLFAGMWQAVRYPWNMDDGGTESGLWRSLDGGDTWKKLSKDLPEGIVGRIAVTVAPSNPDRIYALIETKPSEGLLWTSNDMGDNWSKTNNSHNLDVRPFYFSRMLVSPDDADKVYFLSFFMMRSLDGGKTARYVDPGVHVDHHAIWIDPKDPNRIIQGNDGGAFLSLDGAKSWRFLDGMTLEQDYMVGVDSHSPHNLCAGLQDNSAWCGPATTLADQQITGNDWFAVTSGDGEYTVPAPSDPDLVYVDSQDGAITQFNTKTKRTVFAMPYLHGPGFVADMKMADAKYRFNWTSPIAVSPSDAKTVYLGGNVLFKSSDGGIHWADLSGDLTRNDKSKQELSGGPINKDISGAETYDTILSITLAPSDEKTIWVGTDDGLVQLSRDGGKSWDAVTPSGAPKWTRVYQVGVSPYDAGTAYVGFDGHELDDKHAYVFKTSNYGKSWSRIDKGLPDQPVMVVRESPEVKGFLMLGNMTGMWYSRDAGEHWQQVKADFPTVPVFDVKFMDHDLAVATHGRGLFVFDDIRPFEEMNENAADQAFHLFGAGDGTHFVTWFRGGETQVSYGAPNGPNGVVLDYYLKKEIKNEDSDDGKTPVKIVVTDAAGTTVATVYGPSKQGINRFVWNMQYDVPTKLDFEKEFNGGGGDGGGGFGPLVLPGVYHFAVTVDGKTQTTQAKVGFDPNQSFDANEAKAQTALALNIRSKQDAYAEMLNRLTAMKGSLDAFTGSVDGMEDADKARYKAVADQAKALSKKLGDLKSSVYNTDVQRDAPEDDIHYLAKLDTELQFLSFGVAGDPQPVLQSVTDLDNELTPKLDDALAKFNALLAKDVPDYNKAAFAAGAPTVLVGEPIAIKPAPRL
ncbi:MAG TPA: hypothetical protein VH327_00830 [Gammaproteobacteria bacterium]|jgi:photosystem II stability/assembly factor-like uncharacterized protein|nr:hypothetical protein [Gammaproteobacteria bacterium]